MNIEWLETARKGASSSKPYLQLKFRSVNKPIVVEVAEGKFVEFSIDDYRIGDDGVGWFEYHGFRGNHTRPFVEVLGIFVENMNGEDVSAELAKQLSEDFENGLIEATCEEIP